jgi:hypothetical protein
MLPPSARLKMETVWFSETLVLPTSLHGDTTQKNNIVILTVVITLDLNRIN